MYGTIRELYRKGEVSREYHDTWLVDWTSLGQYFKQTFFKWENSVKSRQFQLCLDVMGRGLNDLSNVDQVIAVSLSDSDDGLVEHTREEISHLVNDSHRSTASWNVYGWKVWRAIKTYCNKTGVQPDLIVMRPVGGWNMEDISFHYDIDSLTRIFNAAAARFLIIERLYESLADGWEMYIEIPASNMVDYRFTVKHFMDEVLYKAEGEDLELLDRAWNNWFPIISAIRITKISRENNPIHRIQYCAKESCRDWEVWIQK